MKTPLKNAEIYYFDTKAFLEDQLVKVATVGTVTKYGTILGYDKATGAKVCIIPSDAFETAQEAIEYAHDHYTMLIKGAQSQIDEWNKNIKNFQDYIEILKSHDRKIV